MHIEGLWLWDLINSKLFADTSQHMFAETSQETSVEVALDLESSGSRTYSC